MPERWEPEPGKWYYTQHEGGTWVEFEPAESLLEIAEACSDGLNEIPSKVEDLIRVQIPRKEANYVLAAAVWFPDGRIYDPVLKHYRSKDCLDFPNIAGGGWDYADRLLPEKQPQGA